MARLFSPRAALEPKYLAANMFASLHEQVLLFFWSDSCPDSRVKMIPHKHWKVSRNKIKKCFSGLLRHQQIMALSGCSSLHNTPTQQKWVNSELSNGGLSLQMMHVQKYKFHPLNPWKFNWPRPHAVHTNPQVHQVSIDATTGQTSY